MAITELLSKHTMLSTLIPFMLGKVQQTLSPGGDLDALLLREPTNYREFNFTYECQRYLFTPENTPRPLSVKVAPSRLAGCWDVHLVSTRQNGTLHYLLTLVFGSSALAALAGNSINAELA